MKEYLNYYLRHNYLLKKEIKSIENSFKKDSIEEEKNKAFIKILNAAKKTNFYPNFYDENGQNFASCEMMGGWIDLKERKLTGLPPEMVENLDSLTHTDDFKVLTKEDTRKHGRKPQDIDPELLT